MNEIFESDSSDNPPVSIDELRDVSISLEMKRGQNNSSAMRRLITEKHDVADRECLVDAGGYLTAPAPHELSGRLDYQIRYHIGK